MLGHQVWKLAFSIHHTLHMADANQYYCAL